MAITSYQLGPAMSAFVMTWHRSQIRACALLGAACAGTDHDARTAVRSDSAGIEIVISTGVDRPLDWRFVPDWTAGGDPDGPTTFYRVTPNLVASDGAGRFYVLDAANGRVVQLAPDGTHLRVFGRAGEGPGELGRPVSLTVDTAGVSAIFDYSKMALVRFDAEGTSLDGVPFRHPPPPVAGHRHMRALGDDYVVSTTEFGAMNYVLRRVGRDSSIIAEIELPPSTMQEYPSCGMGLRLPPLLVPEVSWDAHGSEIAVSASAEYRVDLLNGASSGVRSVRRDLPQVEATRDLAAQELGDGFVIRRGSNPCIIPTTEMVEKRGYGDVVPRIDRVALSPAGDLWVQRRVLGSRGTGPIDVFDPDGTYLGTLPPDFPFPVVFASQGRMGAAVRDDLDIERLAVGRVRKGPDEQR